MGVIVPLRLAESGKSPVIRQGVHSTSRRFLPPLTDPVPERWPGVSDKNRSVNQGPSSNNSSLASLWADLVRARAALTDQRNRPTHHGAGNPREDVARALENYLGLISSKGYPLPYALIAELRMLRRIGPGAT